MISMYLLNLKGRYPTFVFHFIVFREVTSTNDIRPVPRTKALGFILQYLPKYVFKLSDPY